MLLTIPDLLTAEQVSSARERLDKAEWVDGKGDGRPSVGAREEEPAATRGSSRRGRAWRHDPAALQRNALFVSAALPLRVFPPLFNRYQGGHTFGNHIDNAIRQVASTGHRIRTDLSATVFLADPGEYEGGELVIEDTYGVHRVSFQRGTWCSIRASSLHSVTSVTNGARIASFFWIQSMIRDDGARSLLFDLDAIQRADLPAHPSVVQLTGVYHNLLRQWAEM